MVVGLLNNGGRWVPGLRGGMWSFRSRSLPTQSVSENAMTQRAAVLVLVSNTQVYAWRGHNPPDCFEKKALLFLVAEGLAEGPMTCTLHLHPATRHSPPRHRLHPPGAFPTEPPTHPRIRWASTKPPRLLSSSAARVGRANHGASLLSSMRFPCLESFH